jgi:hypothetical protein
MTAPINVLRDRLEQFLRREVVEWEGLPAKCTEQDLEVWLSLSSGEGIAHLGTDGVQYRFRTVEAIGFTEPVRLYFRGETLRLVRAGLWSSNRLECERVLRSLGDPQARLDLAFGMRLIPDGEWIYESRGLALAVIPDTGLIAYVSAYIPCNVDEYRRYFHDAEFTREFRGPRQL